MKILFLFLSATAIAIALAELYHVVTPWVQEPWIGAAAVHSLIAVIVMMRFRVWEDLSWREEMAKIPGLIRWLRRWPLTPAIVVVVGSTIMAWVSSRDGQATYRAIGAAQIAWICWIPVVEEWVFRLGVSRHMQRLGGPWLGMYMSALVFSVVHTDPTLKHVLAGQVGLALGPFILALCNELLYKATGKRRSIIGLHAACNGTVVIFSLIDARWLERLGAFYG